MRVCVRARVLALADLVDGEAEDNDDDDTARNARPGEEREPRSDTHGRALRSRRAEPRSPRTRIRDDGPRGGAGERRARHRRGSRRRRKGGEQGSGIGPTGRRASLNANAPVTVNRRASRSLSLPTSVSLSLALALSGRAHAPESINRPRARPVGRGVINGGSRARFMVPNEVRETD